MDSITPKRFSNSELRDTLEALNDQVVAAIEGSKYPPYGHDNDDKDVREPKSLSVQRDFADINMQRWVLVRDSWITSYADEAERRDYDPALRRLAKELDKNLITLADKLRPAYAPEMTAKQNIAALKHNPIA